MFAVLGDITFEVVTSPETFQSTRSYDYAEHKLVQARPRLQWIANALETITLGIAFHVRFADPAASMRQLSDAAAAHKALPLVFGNGIHRGYFIIATLNETFRATADDGTPISIEATIELKEWVRGAELDVSAPPKPDEPPLAVVSKRESEPPGRAPRAGAITAVMRADGTLVFVDTRTGDVIRELGVDREGLSAVVLRPGDPGFAIAGPPSPTDVKLSEITRSQPDSDFPEF